MLLFCLEEAGRGGVSVYMGATHSPFHLSLSFIIQSQQKVCSEKLHLILIRRAPIIIFPVITALLSLFPNPPAHTHTHTSCFFFFKFFISFSSWLHKPLFSKNEKEKLTVGLLIWFFLLKIRFSLLWWRWCNSIDYTVIVELINTTLLLHGSDSNETLWSDPRKIILTLIKMESFFLHLCDCMQEHVLNVFLTCGWTIMQMPDPDIYCSTVVL